MTALLMLWVLSGAPPCAPVPSAVRAEVERLLKEVAAHSATSHACVDGGGEVVSVEVIGVCRTQPGPGFPAAVTARYSVTRTLQMGLVVGCSHGNCAPMPRVEKAEATFELSLRPGGQVLLRVPLPPPNAPSTGPGSQSSLPGFPTFTPLNQTHDGACFGRHGPFVPREVPWPEASQK